MWREPYLQMKKTYYTKTDGGEFIVSHIGMADLSSILAAIVADEIRSSMNGKIESALGGIDLTVMVREAVQSVDASEMAEEAVREAIEDMVSNNLSVDVSI
jgi:hypothetical protein